VPPRNPPQRKSPNRFASDPRRAAQDIVAKVMEPESRLYAQELLAEKIASCRFKDEDRRFMTELTYGLIRHRGTLDAILGAYTSQPVAGLETDVRLALELGLYQTLFLERIPPHAAVNEVVRLVREAGKTALLDSSTPCSARSCGT